MLPEHFTLLKEWPSSIRFGVRLSIAGPRNSFIEKNFPGAD
jgi:hypothetical protein